MKSAAALSPIAGRPEAPSAPGLSMVPDASMTADARMSSSSPSRHYADDKRRVVAARVLHPIAVLPGHGDDARSCAESVRPAPASATAARGTARPGRRQSDSRRAAAHVQPCVSSSRCAAAVDREFPGREQPNVAPPPNAIANSRTGLEDDRASVHGQRRARQPRVQLDRRR